MHFICSAEAIIHYHTIWEDNSYLIVFSIQVCLQLMCFLAFTWSLSMPNNWLQAILPLRGKILNIERKDEAALYKNEEIQNLILALGLGVKVAYSFTLLSCYSFWVLSNILYF
jgi:hypothetical protein